MAKYRVVKFTNNKIILRDVGPWNQHKTITNDAESVIAELHRDRNLTGRRVFYYDSNDDPAELTHNNKGRFTGFAFWRGEVNFQ